MFVRTYRQPLTAELVQNGHSVTVISSKPENIELLFKQIAQRLMVVIRTSHYQKIIREHDYPHPPSHDELCRSIRLC